MKLLRKDIVAAARSMIGTPFHHQARVPGRDGGVDCIGLLVCVSRILGVEPHDFTAYSRQPDPEQLLQHLRRGMDEISRSSATTGDTQVVWWESDDEPQHFVLLTERGTIIHALSKEDGTGRVREQRMPPKWRRQVHSAWSFKGASY